MISFKRFFALFFVSVFLPCLLFSQAQVLKAEQTFSQPTWQRVQNIEKAKYLEAYMITNSNSLLSRSLKQPSKPVHRIWSKTVTLGENPASRFGFAMEPVLKEMISSQQGRRNIWLYAGYEGIHGIDGLLVKPNSRGQITEVNVYEFKTQNAKLGKMTLSGPQMSKKWILSSIKKNIAQREKDLLKLKDKIEKAKANNNSSLARTLKEEYSQLNKERNKMLDAEKLIQQGKYKRFVIRLRYDKGQIVTTSQEILRESKDGTPRLGAEEKMENLSFSILDEDSSSLTAAQKRFKTSFLREVRKELLKQGYTEADADVYISKIKENGIDINDSVTNSAIENVEKNRIRLQRIIKTSFALLAIASEGYSLYQWRRGAIATSDFVFTSLANVAGLGSLFIKAIGESAFIMTAVFCVIDAAKNIWLWCSGKKQGSEVIVEALSNIIAMAVATLLSSAIGGISVIATLNPVFGTFIGLLVFSGLYWLTNKILKWLGYKIVNHYEAIKKPAQFAIICDDLRSEIYNQKQVS